MFKIILSDPNIFKNSFKAIASIVEEVRLEINPEKLTINAIDGSHITYIILKLEERLFDVYDVDKKYTFNISMKNLTKFLQKSKTDDVLELTYDDENLLLILENNIKKVYKINPVEVKQEVPEPPTYMEYPVKINVPINILKEAIQNIELVSDRIEFNADPEILNFIATGDCDNLNVEYIHNERIADNVKSLFVIKYLKEMLKAEKFSNNGIVCLGDDMPLSLIYRLPHDEGELTFILAPRIEED